MAVTAAEGIGELAGALLEAAPDAMVVADEHGKIRLVNAQAEVMFGYPRAELLGCDIEMLMPDRFRGRHRSHRQQYAVNGRVRPMGADLDLFARHRTGREFPVEINLSPLLTSAGLLVSAAVRDVTDRAAAEQRTREMAMIAESSQDAILTKTMDGVISDVSGIPPSPATSPCANAPSRKRPAASSSRSTSP